LKGGVRGENCDRENSEIGESGESGEVGESGECDTVADVFEGTSK
jgi:hypothetical protein